MPSQRRSFACRSHVSPQPLYQIIYHSLATGDELPPEALAELLRRARSYNQAHRLTGVLLYAAATREFAQVIEGPRDELAALYARIARDPRHEYAFVLHKGPAQGRMFPTWRLGFARRHPGPAHHHWLATGRWPCRPAVSAPSAR